MSDHSSDDPGGDDGVDLLSAVLGDGPERAGGRGDGSGGDTGDVGVEGGEEVDNDEAADPRSAPLWEAVRARLPSRAYRQAVATLIRKLTGTVQSALPGASVEVYGSTITDTHLDGGDVDVVVRTSENGIDRLVSALAGASIGAVVDLRHLRVPLVRVVSGGVDIDITFNRPYGPQNTALILALSNSAPAFRPLCLAIKVWKSVRRLPDARNRGLSSYGWTLLVMHFLQHNPDACRLVSHVPDPEDAEPRGGPLCELLRRFYAHVLRFDREAYVVCVRKVGQVTRDSKRWRSGVEGDVCIEDPIETWRNIGKIVSASVWRQIHAEVLRGLLLTSCPASCGELFTDASVTCASGGAAVNQPRLLLLQSGLGLGVVRGVDVRTTPSAYSKELMTSMKDIDVEVDVLRPVKSQGSASTRTFLPMTESQLLHPCSLLGKVDCVPITPGGLEHTLSGAGQQAMAEMASHLKKWPARLLFNRLLRLRDEDDTGNDDDDDDDDSDGFGPSKRARLR